MKETELLKQIKLKAKRLRRAAAKLGIYGDEDIIKAIARIERMKTR